MQIAISKLSWFSNAIHSPMSSSLLKSSGSVLRSSIARFWTLTPFRVRSPFTITYLKEDICLIRSFGQQYFTPKREKSNLFQWKHTWAIMGITSSCFSSTSITLFSSKRSFLLHGPGSSLPSSSTILTASTPLSKVVPLASNLKKWFIYQN